MNKFNDERCCNVELNWLNMEPPKHRKFYLDLNMWEISVYFCELHWLSILLQILAISTQKLNFVPTVTSLTLLPKTTNAIKWKQQLQNAILRTILQNNFKFVSTVTNILIEDKSFVKEVYMYFVEFYRICMNLLLVTVDFFYSV